VDFFKSESYVFSPEKTNTLLHPYNDYCYFPSLAYAGVRSQLGGPGDDLWWQALAIDIIESAAVKKNITGAGSNDGPFIYTSVHNYTWGFDSDLLIWVNNTFGSLIPNTTINTVVAVQTNSTSEDDTRKRVKYQKDSLRTGYPDPSQLNQYYKFRGQHIMRVWGTEDANTVRGTNGNGFQIDIQGYPTVEIFVDNVFRHVKFVSNMTESVQGINTLLYFIDKNEFNNSNKAYYLDAPSGVSNITAVNVITQGAPVPIIVSQPHFFSADPYWEEQVVFLPPNNVTMVEKHNTFVFVEPHTGVTMQANKRLQVNLQVKPTLITYPNISSTFIPVLWFEQYAQISTELANEWKSTVGLFLSVIYATPIVMFCLSGVSLFISGVVFLQAYMITRPTEYSPINQ